MPPADIALETADRDRAPGPLFPVCLVLDRLRSAFNVGNIYRLAEVCRVREVVTCGYTATPPHPKLVKTARGCDELVATRHCATSLEAVRLLAGEGYHVMAVETAPAAPLVWQAQWPTPVAFVLGNEALGIDPAAIAECHGLVRLPVFGRKNSLNVGNCAAVVLYEAVRRLSGGGAL